MACWRRFVREMALLAVVTTARSQSPQPKSSSEIRLQFELGQRIGQDIERQDGRITDPAIVAYLQGIANRMSRVAASKPMEVRITAAPQEYVKLLPNGVLYFSAGFLERLENEAELAGLLAHELAHKRDQISPAAGGAVRLFLPPCALSADTVPNGASNERRQIEVNAVEVAVRTVKLAGFDLSAVLDVFSKAAYEHPAWSKAIVSDDLLSIRATIEGDIPPPGGYVVDSSDFVRQHSKIAAALGHSSRKAPSLLAAHQ